MAYKLSQFAGKCQVILSLNTVAAKLLVRRSMKWDVKLQHYKCSSKSLNYEALNVNKNTVLHDNFTLESICLHC